ncbi:hypothetical protein BOX15_Mlig014501g3 [Macrostomum lignano]|uniref:RRM domain-containing protein n=1 Tax=Macrostomum lignano TaxID=282301 RepID=A0A267G3H7_9PLAT|nr:hypothetical protein BOX15_Mlig014501g3 [Macrostomum lignano]
MNLSLEDIIGSKQRDMSRFGHQNSNQPRQSQLRAKIQQDARQFIANRKRQGISDARQLLLQRKPDPVPNEVPEALPVAEPLVPLLLPQKVIANDRYQPPPPPRIDLEYDLPPAPRFVGSRAAAPPGQPVRFLSQHQPPLPRRRLATAAPVAQPAPRQNLRPAPQLPPQPHRYDQPPGRYYPDEDYSVEPEDFAEEYYYESPAGHEYTEIIDDLDEDQHQPPVEDEIYDDYEPSEYDYAHAAEMEPRYVQRQSVRYEQRRPQFEPGYQYTEPEPSVRNGASTMRLHLQERRPVVAAAATAAVPRAPRPSRPRAAASAALYGGGSSGGGGGEFFDRRQPQFRQIDADGDVEMVAAMSERRRHRSRSPQLARPSTAFSAAAAAAGAPSRSSAAHRQSHQGLSGRAVAAQPAAAAAGTSSGRSTEDVVKAYKVSISGLHHSVTRDDIYELFSSVGSVRKCSMLGSGKAEVVFPDRAEAETAVKRYNNRELDGVPMRLQISMVGIRLQSGKSSR